MSKSIIHLEDIKSFLFRGVKKETESFYIELEKEFKKELFKTAVELSPRKP
jgi:hypothetical protein